MNNQLKLLDCTLRDGGYINNWEFGNRKIKAIIEGLTNSGIDIVEIGFLRDEESKADRTVWNQVKEIKDKLPDDKGNTMFSVMILNGSYNVDSLEPYDVSGPDMVRVTFHNYDIDEGLELCKKIINKGYKVSCNPINIMGYSDAELLELLEKINKIHPYVFSIVDTFGSMTSKDLERMVSLVDHNLEAGIGIGLHLHENMAQSYALAQMFLQKHLCRNVIIDASLVGMGRIPGNLPIELISNYLNDYFEKNYSIDGLLDLIEAYIIPIKKEHEWGYSPVYFLSAKNNLHRNYAEYLLNKGNLTHKDVNHILSRITPEHKAVFSAEYADELYHEYLNHCIDDTKARAILTELLHGQRVMLLAPGNTLNTCSETIDKYINNNKPVVISINFVPGRYPVDYVFLSNAKRYGLVKRTNCKKITTSNLNVDSDYQVNYNSLSGAFPQGTNGLVMVLKLLSDLQVKLVVLAGADGYRMEGNYYDNSLRSFTNHDIHYNAEVTEAIRKINIMVEFLTPSLYDR